MPQFSNLQSLNNYVLRAITEVMRNEVADAVRQEWIAMMEKNVYGVYEPYSYERRHKYGGLADPRNIQIVSEKVAADSATIVMENLTKGQGWDHYYGDLINTMIESADGFAGNSALGMPKRPYTEEAVDFMTKGIGRNTILDALTSGLARRGININIK